MMLKRRTKFVHKNFILAMLDPAFKQSLNVLRFGSGGFEHERKKFEICYELNKTKCDFVTEARMRGGGICDVLDVSNGVVYEVLSTETIESFKEKTKKYPVGLEIIPVRV